MAIVIERTNVEGALSKVYYTMEDKKLALEHTLMPGEGMFQADLYHDYWHSVSAIHKIDASKNGCRSILGLDIEQI